MIFAFIVSLLRRVAKKSVRFLLGVEDDRQVEMPRHYVEVRGGAQCATDHFLFNSSSPANTIACKDLSVSIEKGLELTIGLVVC
jgi:hypothetical protein